jgi:ferredoxin-type protein NapH
MQGALNFSRKNLVVPGVAMLAFWVLGMVGWLSSGYWQALAHFGYLGTALGVGLGLYGALPKKKKPMGRRLSLLLIGVYLFVFTGLLGQENIQLEGVFLGLLTGVVQAAVVHYLVAKVFGPVLFGRLWCGWACWSVMVFDLLPYRRSAGRLPGKWGWLRYLHFFLSLGLVLAVWFLAASRPSVVGQTAVVWFLVGNLLYYGIGIGLAVALKDNRAFCKYVCPVSVLLKVTSRFSLLKIEGDAEKCNDCNACTKMCPMDIRIPDYIHDGTRVLSTECSLCQTCITVCARDALKLSFGADLGGRDCLRVRDELPA